ncbi:aminoacyl-tRNA hydrolase [Desulfurivibrio dismutans]|uniref:aminoacyl-tRNA hydrolase n=1 Tax=Desulfurivibrio dismutans TaxID=1398908 RepID=UPI0023DB7401|nr:aminoacyl-tRNA hydrolase [Desulfurivibrio alkaliphilus]MDF1615297.1 aminoacyl-tRNA hydrolase [Desulfurivibrio alkaliphilus]
MRLLVGLGNPGGEYELTRHNVGFIFADYLADRHGISLKNEKKWDAEVGRGALWGQPVMLVKPLTYMNRSGLAVGKIARFFQLDPASVVVFQDELDLPLGACRLAQGRGAGGHNGIKSVMDHLASRDFVRIRIGVGRPTASRAAAGFVLSRFSQSELQVLDKLLPFLEEGLETLFKRDLKTAMNLINASTGAALEESD